MTTKELIDGFYQHFTNIFVNTAKIKYDVEFDNYDDDNPHWNNDIYKIKNIKKNLTTLKNKIIKGEVKHVQLKEYEEISIQDVDTIEKHIDIMCNIYTALTNKKEITDEDISHVLYTIQS